jgi:hypothetical protein
VCLIAFPWSRYIACFLLLAHIAFVLRIALCKQHLAARSPIRAWRGYCPSTVPRAFYFGLASFIYSHFARIILRLWLCCHMATLLPTFPTRPIDRHGLVPLSSHGTQGSKNGPFRVADLSPASTICNIERALDWWRFWTLFPLPTSSSLVLHFSSLAFSNVCHQIGTHMTKFRVPLENGKSTIRFVHTNITNEPLFCISSPF